MVAVTVAALTSPKSAVNCLIMAADAKLLLLVLVSTYLCSSSAFVTTVPMLRNQGVVREGRFSSKNCRGPIAFRKSSVRVKALAGPPPPSPAALSHPLAKLLADCKDFGLVRFISVNPNGSVLETAARMDLGMSGFTVPGKGQYITIASDDKLFECHINLDLVRTVTLTQDPAKIGGHTLHVMRLKDEKGAILLSCMLQYDPSKGPGSYFPGAVEAFESVMKKHGPSIPMPSPAT